MDMLNLIEETLKKEDISYRKNEALKNYTSFKIGGNCSFLVFPKNVHEVVFLIKFCNDNFVPKLFLGNGSNLLIPDSGFFGIGICSKMLNSAHLVSDCEIYCESGANLTRLCYFLAEKSLSGLEFACGIPGTLGGAVAMNAGAYGGEIKDLVEETNNVSSCGKLLTLGLEDLDFSYRHSVYSFSENFMLGAKLKFAKSKREEIEKLMESFIAERKLKQPLNFPSAGSVFKRPKGNFAAALIEKCGLKGLRIGGAMVSEKHCGFIVNVGGASYFDVVSLIKKIQNVVKKKTGVFLEPEIKIIQ